MYPSHLNVSNVSRNKGFLPFLKFNSKVNADYTLSSEIQDSSHEGRQNEALRQYFEMGTYKFVYKTS